MIRNASTHQFRAVRAIQGRIRWCLTGTPIQNSLDDLGCLVTFLRLPILMELTQFRRYITRQTNSAKTSRPPDFESLRLLLGAICLRRSKAILPVSRSENFVHSVQFSWGEKKAYEQLGNTWREAIDLAVSGHKSKEAHQTVLEALLRMRIYCNNGNYLNRDQLSEPDEIGSLLQQSGSTACFYCSCDVLSFGNIGDSSSGTITVCRRAVCGECHRQYREQMRKYNVCPICEVRHASQIEAFGTHEIQGQLNARPFPAKLEILCKDIERHRNDGKRYLEIGLKILENPTDRNSIVFSFWKKSLDIVGTMLTFKDLAYLRVDGTLPHGQRKRVLSKFQGAEQGMVLLMTLGTGAMG